jgi:hypothetical protein
MVKNCLAANFSVEKQQKKAETLLATSLRHN